MAFLILAGISGIILAVAPFWAARMLRNRWKMPRGVFLKAGLAMLMIEIIHLAATGNAQSLWPQVGDWPLPLQALLFGLAAGLFMELGRFLVLDRLFKTIRTVKEGIYFGIGWNGLETAIVGFAIVVGIIGLQTMSGNIDLSKQFPNASTTEISQLQDFRNQALQLMQGNPVAGLAPLLERGSLMAIDIFLTLLIILGLTRGATSYIWAAVALRTLFEGTLIYAGTLNSLAGEAVFVVYGIMAFFLARFIARQLKSSSP